jgi:signal transduction histidine kinase
MTLWYTTLLLVVLLLFGLSVLRIEAQLGQRRVDRELDTLAGTLIGLLREELGEGTPSARAAGVVRDTMSAPGRAFAVVDAHGAVLAERWSGLELPDVAAFTRDAPPLTTLRTGTGEWRVRAERMAEPALVLMIGTPLADIDREQAATREAMLMLFPIVLLLAAGGGLWLASVGLRPITSALEIQRQFMADASHELRTPVSVVRAAADVTLGRAQRDETEYREALTIIHGQARAMSRLVEDMLVLSRAEAGGYGIQAVDLYLDELVTECRRSVDLIASERQVAIRLTAPSDLPFRGDEDLLRRCVINVLRNAVQHTPAGGTVDVDVQADASAVRIRITDHGSGIAPGDQQRIFDRFVQLDPARRGEGTGVGLPIARWIAEAHRGTLVLERSDAGGSTFVITLPRS